MKRLFGTVFAAMMTAAGAQEECTAARMRMLDDIAAMARDAKNRELIAKVIAPQAYLNQPETVIAQVLTGKFADGLGNIRNGLLREGVTRIHRGFLVKGVATPSM